MSKKVIKKICLFALILVTFFGFSGNLKAYQTRAIYPHPFTTNLEFFMNQVGSHPLETGIYTVNGKHAYCIEPGVKIDGTKGYDTTNAPSLENYNSGYFSPGSGVTSSVITRRNFVTYILTFAENQEGIAEANYNKPNWSTIAANLAKRYEDENDLLPATYKIFAAQGMIWEVVTGERTNFNNVWPDNHAGYDCSFYDVIYGVIKNNEVVKNKDCNGQEDTSSIKEEYDRIIRAIRGTFLNDSLGEAGGKTFVATEGAANKVPLSYNSSTGKYTLTIHDTDFQYWKVYDSNGLDVTVGSNYITISSSESISEGVAKTVAITVKETKNGTTGTTVYVDDSLQDVVAIGGTTQVRYIKVYTPNYQIRINKKASLDGGETSENLAGAKFNVCSNSSCTDILGTITTNSSGVATFDEIKAPGTYYVKETVAPPGYELDTTPHAITVSTSNVAGSGSYGSITITDEKKVFDLTKMTVDEDGNSTILNDGCGTDTYIGPTFQLRQNGESLYFKPVKKDGVVVPGHYELASSDTEGATTDLRTCNGRLRVYALTSCNYTISETKPPEGLTLPSEPNRNINVCGSDKTISLTNGYAGLEFQKKNEDGVFLAGGKFSLQMKVNNVYRDVLLKELGEGNYTYDANLTEEDEGATYIITTKDGSEDGEEKGIARISKLPPGEYRIVEKEAPEGYELIEDKDSNAVITIKDTGADDYYIVEMIDQKVLQNGSRASAELVVTITTGRRVPNYVVIIASLAVLLVITIILRKRIKK